MAEALRQRSGGRVGSSGEQGGRSGGRLGSMTGAAYPATDTKDQAMEPTLVLCVEAFANSLLVPSGHVTFKDVYAAFKSQFPLLADEKFMPPNFLGAHLRDWYKAKYHKDLVREEGVKGESKRRSALPYRDLSLVPDVSTVDATLMNEAKGALRRALKMEGVGIMVRRNKAGQYVVATMMPGSPAALAGNVEADDVLLAVGGHEVEGLTPQQLADVVLGPRGSVVSVTLRRSAVQRMVEGESQTLERVYTVQLVRSDKPVAQPTVPKLSAAERYATNLASQVDTAVSSPK